MKKPCFSAVFAVAGPMTQIFGEIAALSADFDRCFAKNETPQALVKIIQSY
jgi:hypothetical protein